jgi:hypothetical protein
MKKRRVMLAAAMLVIAWCAVSTARADPWPQSAISEYFSSCVTVHNDRWRGIPEATVTRVCTCKVSKLQTFPWEQFANANKEVSSYALEQFVALPESDQESLLKDAAAKRPNILALVMLRVVGAEEECAPK